MANGIGKISALFKPVYNELQTYIIALICVLLLITHMDIRAEFARVGALDLLGMIPLAALAIFGGALSIFNVLVRRPKERWEKTAMAGLAMGANGAAGLVGGAELLPKGLTLAAIIPLWNIVTSVLLLRRIGLDSEDALTDEDATSKQVAVATGWLFGVFAICEWYLGLTWPMTFSVSTAFASISGHFIAGVDSPKPVEQGPLPRRGNRGGDAEFGARRGDRR